MTGAPELERADGRDENVKDKRSRTNDSRREAEQRHGRDVTRRAGVTNGRIKKCDQPDGEKKENEMSGVHALSRRAESRHL